MKFTMQDSSKKKAAKLSWPPEECRLPDDETLAALSGQADGDPDHDLDAFFAKSLQEAAEREQKKRRAKALKKLRRQIDMAADPLKRIRLPRPGDYWAPPALDRIYR